MSMSIDWNNIKLLPEGITESFEKFCFHVACHKFAAYGNVSYFYQTPGSEFYIKLNKPVSYAGLQLAEGDVIGWQAKYWFGKTATPNSPLGVEHRAKLIENFRTTLDYEPTIKLWIICTPYGVKQSQWNTLIRELSILKSDCVFESWHKDIFEAEYYSNPHQYNSIFQFFFGDKYLDKEKLDCISKDTLSILTNKFDVDLHSPTNVEKLLLSIVDKESASKILREKIQKIYERYKKQIKHPVQQMFYWDEDDLPSSFKSAYIEDCKCRYDLINKLYTYIDVEKPLINYALELKNIIIDYNAVRQPRIDLLKREIEQIAKNHILDNHAISSLIGYVDNLESLLTKQNDKRDLCLCDYLCLFTGKDFSIFAEAGYGKTHFACSVVQKMLDKSCPVLFFMGSHFQNCNSSESLIQEKLSLQHMSFEDILDALDFLGEIYDCKVLIVIDGLNETAPRDDRWKIELPPLRRKIRERNNLVLITTCREKDDYIRVIYDCESFKDVDNPYLLPGIEHRNIKLTTARYFKKYDIQPTNKIVYKHFTNPLLLKIFCQVNEGRHDIEINDYSLTSCLKKYSDDIIRKISSDVTGRFDRVKEYKLKQGLNQVAQYLWENNARSIHYFKNFCSYMDGMHDDFIAEGLFILDKENNPKIRKQSQWQSQLQ